MTDNDRYKLVLTAFSRACIKAGLTQTETVVLGAQFTGMAIATCPTAAAHQAQLEVAAKAMVDAYSNKIVGGQAPTIFMPEG